MSRTVLGAQGDRAEQIPEDLKFPSVDGQPLPYLLGQKISVPEKVIDRLERRGLVERAMPTHRRLTVLQAPAGFGKTTLLADCCRRLIDEGVSTAWVSLDPQDEAKLLDTYVACACWNATAVNPSFLEMPQIEDTGVAKEGIESRTGFVMRVIADLGRPFVLVFDELEHLANPDSAAFLDFLLQRGPPNLHLAFACRQIPAGVNVAGAVLDGSAEMLTLDDLRFSRSEVAKFFDGKLSRAQLAKLMTESAGWPLALRISRSQTESGWKGASHATQKIVENWLESRLFAGLAAEDRDFLLDIGLFEWMDAALVDEVLERNDSIHRIETLSFLVGMLESFGDGSADRWRLPPLIRKHCARRRFRDTPQRFSMLHRRLASALERRGITVVALQHAVEAGEPALAGDILERAGGVSLFFSKGEAQFQLAHRLLSEETFEGRPRLALFRCASLILDGRMEEAKEKYLSLTGKVDGSTTGGNDAELQLATDNSVVRGLFLFFGGEHFGPESMRSHLTEIDRLVQLPRLDITARGFMEYNYCVAAHTTADFEIALEHAARARQCFENSPYMRTFTRLQEGQAAMAQGRMHDASAIYNEAKQTANACFASDLLLTSMCEALLLELAVECGRNVQGRARTSHVPEALRQGNAPFQAYVAASGAIVQSLLQLGTEGVESALSSTIEMLTDVRGRRHSALVRHVTALRVLVLVIAGRLDEGERVWDSGNLPKVTADCLDLSGQTWQEMESLSCARLRLEIGRERFVEARQLAADLIVAAEERGLRRTQMRTLALSIVLEVRAGDANAAAGHLKTYLQLYAATTYAGSLIVERKDCAPVVAAFLESGPDSSHKEAARALMAVVEGSHTSAPVLSERERDVLLRIGDQQSDKQIAIELGLSAFGVRHHIRKLFDRLGVNKRGEAVIRARELGLIP